MVTKDVREMVASWLMIAGQGIEKGDLMVGLRIVSTMPFPYVALHLRKLSTADQRLATSDQESDVCYLTGGFICD